MILTTGQNLTPHRFARLGLLRFDSGKSNEEVLSFYSLFQLAGGIFVAIIFIFFANYADRYKAMVTTT